MDPVPLFAGFGGFMIGLLIWSLILQALLVLWVIRMWRPRRHNAARTSARTNEA